MPMPDHVPRHRATWENKGMFAITGITGQVGGAVARTLLSAGMPVRTVLRDAGKAGAWAEQGCDIALAAFTDVPALTEAFKDTDGVFVLIPPIFDPEPGNPEALLLFAALTRALEAARPRGVVFLSTIGAQARQPNLLSWLGIMERQFSTLSMPVSFLGAAWFMENAAWDVEPARDSGTIASFLQPLDRPVPMVATADIGRAAARMLGESWSGCRVIELEGPRRVTPNEIAASFATILGRPVHAQAVPREGWAALFTAQGMRNPAPRMRMLDGFNEGWIAFEAGEAGSEKGD